jgi:hypothetical protein
MGIIVNIRVEILSSPRMVCLLTLMSGQCHRRRGLVNPHRLCWELGPAGGQ